MQPNISKNVYSSNFDEIEKINDLKCDIKNFEKNNNRSQKSIILTLSSVFVTEKKLSSIELYTCVVYVCVCVLT